MKKVYIIILNWNGWQDTIECLESVFRLDYPEFRVIVCDNNSQDGSLENIKAWAEGRKEADVTADNPLRRLTFPPVAKPITYVEYDRSQAEAGSCDGSASMILIKTGANLGFAGGNNIGMRYALARGDFAYVWLLNNDTIVKPDALAQMVQRMEEKPDAGMCGALIPFYNKPEIIWAAGGGIINKWLIKSASIDYGKHISKVSAREEIEPRMDYLAGASMLVSADFLRSVGLMDENYFLYFEEPDWYMRGKHRFSLAYADKAIVYHKVGISASKLDVNRKGILQYAPSGKFYLTSQLRFTAKFYPLSLPLVLFRIVKYYLKLIFFHH